MPRKLADDSADAGSDAVGSRQDASDRGAEAIEGDGSAGGRPKRARRTSARAVEAQAANELVQAALAILSSSDSEESSSSVPAPAGAAKRKGRAADPANVGSAAKRGSKTVKARSTRRKGSDDESDNDDAFEVDHADEEEGVSETEDEAADEEEEEEEPSEEEEEQLEETDDEDGGFKRRGKGKGRGGGRRASTSSIQKRTPRGRAGKPSSSSKAPVADAGEEEDVEEADLDPSRVQSLMACARDDPSLAVFDESELRAAFRRVRTDRDPLPSTPVSFAVVFSTAVDSSGRTRRRYNWTKQDLGYLRQAIVKDRADKEMDLQAAFIREKLRYNRAVQDAGKDKGGNMLTLPVPRKPLPRYNRIAAALGIDEETAMRRTRRSLALDKSFLQAANADLDAARAQIGVKVYTQGNAPLMAHINGASASTTPSVSVSTPLTAAHTSHGAGSDAAGQLLPQASAQGVIATLQSSTRAGYAGLPLPDSYADERAWDMWRQAASSCTHTFPSTCKVIGASLALCTLAMKVMVCLLCLGHKEQGAMSSVLAGGIADDGANTAEHVAEATRRGLEVLRDAIETLDTVLRAGSDEGQGSTAASGAGSSGVAHKTSGGPKTSKQKSGRLFYQACVKRLLDSKWVAWHNPYRVRMRLLPKDQATGSARGKAEKRSRTEEVDENDADDKDVSGGEDEDSGPRESGKRGAVPRSYTPDDPLGACEGIFPSAAGTYVRRDPGPVGVAGRFGVTKAFWMAVGSGAVTADLGIDAHILSAALKHGRVWREGRADQVVPVAPETITDQTDDIDGSVLAAVLPSLLHPRTPCLDGDLTAREWAASHAHTRRSVEAARQRILDADAKRKKQLSQMLKQGRDGETGLLPLEVLAGGDSGQYDPNEGDGQEGRKEEKETAIGGLGVATMLQRISQARSDAWVADAAQSSASGTSDADSQARADASSSVPWAVTQNLKSTLTGVHSTRPQVRFFEPTPPLILSVAPAQLQTSDTQPVLVSLDAQALAYVAAVATRLRQGLTSMAQELSGALPSSQVLPVLLSSQVASVVQLTLGKTGEDDSSLPPDDFSAGLMAQLLAHGCETQQQGNNDIDDGEGIDAGEVATLSKDVRLAFLVRGITSVKTCLGTVFVRTRDAKALTFHSTGQESRRPLRIWSGVGEAAEGSDRALNKNIILQLCRSIVACVLTCTGISEQQLLAGLPGIPLGDARMLLRWLVQMGVLRRELSINSSQHTPAVGPFSALASDAFVAEAPSVMARAVAIHGWPQATLENAVALWEGASLLQVEWDVGGSAVPRVLAAPSAQGRPLLDALQQTLPDPCPLPGLVTTYYPWSHTLHALAKVQNELLSTPSTGTNMPS